MYMETREAAEVSGCHVKLCAKKHPVVITYATGNDPEGRGVTFVGYCRIHQMFARQYVKDHPRELYEEKEAWQMVPDPE